MGIPTVNIAKGLILPIVFGLTNNKKSAKRDRSNTDWNDSKEKTEKLPETDTSIKDVNQVDLSVFFSQYENDSKIPEEVLNRYLTNPTLMKHQKNVIQTLVDRVQNGKPPLTPKEFYEIAYQETKNKGTALLVCHNITKAMARGFSPIPWQKAETPNSGPDLIYNFDNKEIKFNTNKCHEDAQVVNSRGEPSVFYAMFSPKELGTKDEGDWYHFFVTATSTYYGAEGKLKFNDSGFNIFHPLNSAYASSVDGAIDGAMDQMRDKKINDSNAYKGWRYANSLSYLEGAKYGEDYNGDQKETTRESKLHQQGALFGLDVAGEKADPSWRWYVPKYGAAADAFDTKVDLSNDTHCILNPNGEEIETSKKSK